jgi:hypothetical protein
MMFSGTFTHLVVRLRGRSDQFSSKARAMSNNPQNKRDKHTFFTNLVLEFVCQISTPINLFSPFFVILFTGRLIQSKQLFVARGTSLVSTGAIIICRLEAADDRTINHKQQ